ncbi:hypothetical protein ASPWEDRAFT_107812 [Aspergillus wentii DTO 134E9]|uniref:Zn(2)-C6 fungal-type domain-containing protein n=1 Tax=Aspergillus wentii DTO 134E9 TaxID=1073089 RepID=A0A1L9RN73_ASPWE|nr:uncharacterized protein ASPWEDRAFT_107812 [Aspergillus wentii DTO 134E9]KAI9926023.1 hypothetical protein MW887_004482 [Aspergillus wentii]OJJ36364.1 hypothetical protein ASPWEDRAFT_107812 [Aspergillus wentii DTO 134E9]
MSAVTQGIPRGVRKPRKSRGRGLRATTGCLVCKRRHVKCDEVRPQCGPCAKGQRGCVYGNNGDGSDAAILQIGRTSTTPNPPIDSPTPVSPQVHEPLRALVDACHHENQVQHQNAHYQESLSRSASYRNNQTLSPYIAPLNHGPVASPISPHEYVLSSGTDSSVSTRVAPLSWFELLANDAANTNRDFFLPSHKRAPSARTGEGSGDSLQSPVFQPRNRRERESFQAASFQNDPDIEDRLVSGPAEGSSNTLPDDPSSWNTNAPIQLSHQEYRMFNHFVRKMSSWPDSFDTFKHFATVVPHLALRNVGLMKALLALSARHLSICNETNGYHFSFDNAGRGMQLNSTDTRPASSSEIDRNMAVEYYFETLHYLNKAMRYQSYARSHELIATALLISTYEMIDGSNRDWERHLKGVFWIQRYQNNDGESGGIRQAVWWAWLRQDVWVAMRERRRVFTFWRPKKTISMLTTAEMANRVFWVLAQCINYASREESQSSDIQSRLERGNELLHMLQEWYDHLPREFNPLPIAEMSGIFPAIWVHPAPHAAALQVHSLARILVILHRPSIGGLQDYRAGQKLLTTSVNTICGIARAIDEDEEAASLVSLQCLFGAGMSVHTPHERIALLDLIDTFQRRVRWPAGSLRKDLEFEYQKDELSAFAG